MVRVIVIAAAAGIFTQAALAQFTPILWSGQTNENPASGTLAGFPVSLSNLVSTGASPAVSDLSTPDFSAFPFGAATTTAEYRANSDWKLAFSFPTYGVLLYLVGWRGEGSPMATTHTYTFDQPFTVLSGLGSVTVAGTTLTAPNTGFHSGILRFEGPVSEINLVTSFTDSDRQAIFVAVENLGPSLSVKGKKKSQSNRASFRLRGTAGAAYGVSRVEIKTPLQKKFYRTTVEPTGEWTRRIRLKAGTNRVKIRAISNDGGSTPFTRLRIHRR